MAYNYLFCLLLSLFSAVTIQAQLLWGVGSGTDEANAEFSLPFVNSTTSNYDINSWTALSISDSNGATVPGNAYWERSPSGTSQGAYGAITIMSPTQTNGAALFDSDFLDNGGNVGAFGTGSSPAAQIADLVSPQIDLTNQSNKSITIQFYCAWRAFQVDNFLVSFSTDDGQNWMDFDINSVLPSPTNSSNEGWVNTTFDNATEGITDLTQCRIRFRFDGNYYYAMIDDISLSVNETLSSTDFNGMNSILSLYPNPSSDFLSISNITNTEQYTIYNSIGTAVQSGQVIDDEKIDISRLTEGVYIIKLGHSKALKFAKN